MAMRNSKYLLVALAAVVLVQLALVYSQPSIYIEVKGVVRDAVTGKPLGNTIIVVYNRSAAKASSVLIKTDSEGRFSVGLVPQLSYTLYFIHVNDKGLIDYVPAYITVEKDAMSVECEVKLYPGAVLCVKGDLYYIGGEVSRWRRYVVLNAENQRYSEVFSCGEAVVKAITGESSRVKVGLLDEYGSVLYFVLKNSPIAKTLNESIVVVPADLPVVVLATAPAKNYRTGYFDEVHFYVDNPVLRKGLSQGTFLVYDITADSLSYCVKLIEEDIRKLESMVNEFESIGFYVAEERYRYLDEAKRLVERARSYIMEHRVEEALTLLEKADAIVWPGERGILYNRLMFMKLVAKESAAILPVFLAVFAIAMGMFLHEDLKKKIATTLVFYVLFLVLFIYSYPGFKLIDATKFTVSTIGSLAGALALFFVLPRYFKELEVPGKASFSSIVAITASIAKRYARVRKLRTTITIFSLAILIWAFTVLTSVSTIHTIVSEGPVNVLYSGTAVIVRAYYKDMPESLSLQDTGLCEHFFKPKVLAVRAYLKPTFAGESKIYVGGRRIVSIMGIGPEEREFWLKGNVVEGDLAKLDDEGVLLPKSLAYRIGAKVGDKVVLYIENRIYGVYKDTLTVVGIYDDAAVGNLDIDKKPVLPFILSGGNIVYCNASSIVIVSWKYLMYRLFPDSKTGISRVSSVYSIALVPGSVVNVEAATRSFLECKGIGYYVAVVKDGSARFYHFGERMVIVGSYELLFPILIVVSNVAVTMYSIVKERHREIFILNALGYNPLQIASLFLMESIIYGLIGGGIGYISGIVTYKLMTTEWFKPFQFIVREKLEWYWSIIGVTLSIVISMLSSFRPALSAAYKVSPTLFKKAKVTEEEKIEREEKYLVTYTSKTIGMPIRVHEDEAVVFYSYLYTKLKDLEGGVIERIEDLEELEEEEHPDGKRVKRFKFKYVSDTAKGKVVIDCELIMTKMPKTDYYTVELVAKPKEEEISIVYIDQAAAVIKDIVMGWLKERKFHVG